MIYEMQLIRTRRSMVLPTLGTLFVLEDGKEVAQVETLELPWKENMNGISCIPEGVYLCRKRNTKKRGEHFHITGVPNRTWILIHVANFVRQLRGCIAPGKQHKDIDQDGIIDIASSGVALHQLLKAVKTNNSFKFTVQ